MQKHEGPSNLGRMVNGVFCVKKIEIANIHQAFKTFYVNRKSQVESKSPENATILRKNLSFETQKSKDQISETDTSLKFSKSLLSLPCNDTSIDNIVLNGALSINFIAEEENDESLKKQKNRIHDQLLKIKRFFFRKQSPYRRNAVHPINLDDLVLSPDMIRRIGYKKDG